jgi:transcriptional regulator with XRE-family HTH domain
MMQRSLLCGKTKFITMTSQTDFQYLVHELRGRIGLTQEKFAARLGVTFPTINRWENGHARPSPLALRQIESLLRELGDQGADLLQSYFGNTEAPQACPTAAGTLAGE